MFVGEYAGHVSARVSVVSRLPNHYCSRIDLAKRQEYTLHERLPEIRLDWSSSLFDGTQFQRFLVNGWMNTATFLPVSMLDVLPWESHFHYRHFPDNKLPKPKRSKKYEVPEYIEREDRIDKSRHKHTKLKPIPKLQPITTTTTTAKPSKTAKSEPPKKTKESKAQKPQPLPFKPLKKPELQKAEPAKPKTTNLRKSDDEGTFPTETVS